MLRLYIYIIITLESIFLLSFFLWLVSNSFVFYHWEKRKNGEKQGVEAQKRDGIAAFSGRSDKLHYPWCSSAEERKSSMALSSRCRLRGRRISMEAECRKMISSRSDRYMFACVYSAVIDWWCLGLCGTSTNVWFCIIVLTRYRQPSFFKILIALKCGWLRHYQLQVIDASESFCVIDEWRGLKVQRCGALRVGNAGLLESRWAACWRILRHTCVMTHRQNVRWII